MPVFDEKWILDRVEVDPNGGCWLWSMSLCVDGYGRVRIESEQRELKAHRHSWTILRGPIPDGLHVLHKCDVRCCVNPDHLYLGTREQNMADMVSRNRRGPQAPYKRIPQAQKDMIHRWVLSGTPKKVIARMFGVDPASVRRVTKALAQAKQVQG